MAKANKMNELERELVEGLEEFRDALENGETISERFTCRRVSLELVSKPYTPAKVKRTRAILGVSQGLFAQFLGVSPGTVRSWELGKEPSDIACRFMDEIRRDPEHWKKRLLESVRVKR